MMARFLEMVLHSHESGTLQYHIADDDLKIVESRSTWKARRDRQESKWEVNRAVLASLKSATLQLYHMDRSRCGATSKAVMVTRFLPAPEGRGPSKGRLPPLGRT